MTKVFTFTFLAALAWGSVSAQAVTACGARAEFLKTLKGKFQENGRALGLIGKSNVLEIFTSKEGTWTIMVTGAEGRSCIIAAGNSWEELPPVGNMTAL